MLVDTHLIPRKARWSSALALCVIGIGVAAWRQPQPGLSFEAPPKTLLQMDAAPALCRCDSEQLMKPDDLTMMFSVLKYICRDSCERLSAARTQKSVPVTSLVEASSPPPVRNNKVELTHTIESGIASWYGESFDGRPAASGEVFDMEQLTAAHKTLAFGARVRVHRLDTNTSVDVRINDRGPYVGERIIDLSHAAARKLGMTIPGLVPVALEVISTREVISTPPVARLAGIFAVQIGAFRDPKNAERAKSTMVQRYGTAEITIRRRESELFAVLVGELATAAEANGLAQTIRTEQTELENAFVVQITNRRSHNQN
jgi:rare lipoprotein A